MYRKILVPTDGSDHAAKALGVASDLARTYGADMILLHVTTGDNRLAELADPALAEELPKTTSSRQVKDIEATPHGPVAISGGETRQVDRAEAVRYVAAQILEDAKEVARKHGVATVVTVHEQGRAAERILEVAEREKVEAIVMGNRGRSDLKGAIFGSVSHKVCHRSANTCITVV